ncbi:MAG: transglutaminase-like domain-containing protein, partial [Candidatus Xenobia bacterium]
EAKALLATALCRAAGLPARPVGGLLFVQGNFVPHHWYEVYLGSNGWVPMDPSTGQAASLDATHLALFERGALVSGNIEVTDYAPKPERRVSYFNRELTWSLGEQRTYVIRKGGKVIGTETSLMQLANGKDDNYSFTTEMKIDDGTNKAAGEEKVILTPEGLPISMEYGGNLTPDMDGETVTFGKADIVTDIRGKSALHREIPYSRGVYLADGRFYTGLAMVLGQVPNLRKGRQVSAWIFRPDSLTLGKVDFQVDGEDVIVKGADSTECWRCNGPGGLVLDVDKENNQVVRIMNPGAGIEVDLESTKLKL